MDTFYILQVLEDANPGHSGMYSGVYQIRNITDNKMYIGCSVNLRIRFHKHLRDLKENKHHSQKLQRAWDKYGESSFVFEVIECCSKDELLIREQRWLDDIRPFDKGVGYNICKKARNRTGVKASPETKAKISAANKGKKRSPDVVEAMHQRALGHQHSQATKEKIRQASTGRKHTEEVKKKIGQAQVDKTVSEETRQKLSRANKGNQHWLGKTHTDESKSKMSESQRKRQYTDEEKQKLADKARETHTGKIVSEKTRQKMSISKKGHPVSEETRQKLRDAWKKRKLKK